MLFQNTSKKAAATFRHLKREAVIMGLLDIHPSEAAEICCAFLDELAAGMPGFDPWGDIRADAAFWADLAHPAELETYMAFAIRKLGRRVLGLRMRKRIFREIWSSFPDSERAAFLKTVERGGHE